MLGLRIWHALDGWWGVAILTSLYGLMMRLELRRTERSYWLGILMLWGLAIVGFAFLGLAFVSSATGLGW